jgi:hypothetical protein
LRSFLIFLPLIFLPEISRAHLDTVPVWNPAFSPIHASSNDAIPLTQPFPEERELFQPAFGLPER